MRRIAALVLASGLRLLQNITYYFFHNILGVLGDLYAGLKGLTAERWQIKHLAFEVQGPTEACRRQVRGVQNDCAKFMPTIWWAKASVDLFLTFPIQTFKRISTRSRDRPKIELDQRGKKTSLFS